MHSLQPLVYIKQVHAKVVEERHEHHAKVLAERKARKAHVHTA